MKILFISHYTGLYGANRSLLEMIEGLKERGVESEVVCPNKGPLCHRLTELGVGWHIVPFKSWIKGKYGKAGALWHGAKNLWLAVRASRKFVSSDFDVVYTNSSVTPFGKLLSKIMGLPHVWHLRELIDLHFGLTPELGWQRFRKTIASSNWVICISEAVKNHLLKGEAKERVSVIYNPAGPEGMIKQFQKASQKKGS